MKILSSKLVIYIFIFSFIWILSSQTTQAYTTVSGTISTNQTWNSGQTYLISNATINSGVTVTVDPAAIIKFSASSYLTVNGTLDVNGTSASKSFFTSTRDDTIGEDTSPGDPTAPVAGNWHQIKLNQGASVSMDNTIVRFGGGSSANIYQDGGTLNMSASIIASSSGYGFLIASGSSNITDNVIKDNGTGMWVGGIGTLNLTNNSFIDNTSYPVDLTYQSGRILNASGNTISGTGKLGYFVVGTMDDNQTWNDDLPYIVAYSGITVNSAKTLTLQPGTIVKFDPTSSKTGQLVINGRLVANGTSGDNVYLTSLLDDSIGGDTNNAGGTPAVEDWRHIKFNSGSTASISYSFIRFGGNSLTGGSSSNMYITGGSVDVSYSMIASAYYGLLIEGGSIDVSNSTFKDNGDGVRVYSPATLSLTDNSFIDNTSYPAWFSYGGGMIVNTSGNTINNGSGIGKRGYFASGSIADSQTWGDDLPYIITASGFTIDSGKTLTLSPGTVVKFESGTSNLVVNGSLDSIGTSGDKIYFTSIKDDSAGGDTNNAGGTPIVEDWRHIKFNAGSTASISHSVIRFGANSGFGGSYSNMYITGGSIDLSYSTIASSYYGLLIEGGSADVSNSIFIDNVTNGIYNGTATISAEYNYWGHSSGPTHATNPGGSGNAVTNYVDFAPWLTEAPSPNYIPVAGFINSNTTWSGSTPYVIGAGGLTVNSGKTLTLNPGVIVKMASTSSHLTVNGTLDVNGNANLDSQVYFTSIKDDSVGGNTDGVSATPSAGDWNYIKIGSGGAANIDYTSIRFGASNLGANLYVNGGTLDVWASIIASSAYAQFLIDSGSATIGASTLKDHTLGIFVTDDGNAEIEDSAIYGASTSWGVYNDSGNDVNAFYNYWNAEDWVNTDTTTAGPYSSGHTDRDGSAISDYVNITPLFVDRYREDWFCFNPIKWHCVYPGEYDDAVDDPNNQIRWVASGSFNPYGEDYEADWDFGVDLWDDLVGGIDIVNSSLSSATLQVKIIDDSGSSWDGLFRPSINPDAILLNHYHMQGYSTDRKRNIVTHELGHAHGLWHSFSDNIMNYYTSEQTYFGVQDLIDYYLKW